MIYLINGLFQELMTTKLILEQFFTIVTVSYFLVFDFCFCVFSESIVKENFECKNASKSKKQPPKNGWKRSGKSLNPIPTFNFWLSKKVFFMIFFRVFVFSFFSICWMFCEGSMWKINWISHKSRHKKIMEWNFHQKNRFKQIINFNSSTKEKN